MNQPQNESAAAASRAAAPEGRSAGSDSTTVPADARTGEDPAVATIEQRASGLAREIAAALATAGPRNWRRLEASFALTVEEEIAYALYHDESGPTIGQQPSEEIVELVRRQREVSAELGDGPWWRMTVELDAEGALEVDYDYGDEPFPDDQLLDAEAYRADLEAYPRDRLPVWLAAYIGRAGQQTRSAREAAVRARLELDTGVRAVRSTDDFPVLPVLWSRWAVIAAAFVAVGSAWGPRVLPALGVFEGASRSGSTLYVLPGGRAVLSGGVWNAPELDAAYNDGEPMPDLYAGAPWWVADQVLNPRAPRGMLSFCYWWERDSWFRGGSPAAADVAAAVPGVWSAQSTADVVCRVVSANPSESQRSAAADLVAAAESGVVSRDTVAALFDETSDDLDGALLQLSMAGLVMEVPDELSRDQAIAAVGAHILGLGVDTSSYPVENLVAERVEVGWMVFVPTTPGEISIGRAIFYIADDGVIEQSSSSIAPSRYVEGFQERFHHRKSRAAADFTV